MSRRNDYLTWLRECAIDVFCRLVVWALFRYPDTTIAVLKIIKKDLAEGYLAWLKPVFDQYPGISLRGALEIAKWSLAYKEFLAIADEVMNEEIGTMVSERFDALERAGLVERFVDEAGETRYRKPGIS